MSNNKNNDLLSEQRRRQAELINLKKMQQGIDGTSTAIAEPDPINCSKWKNFLDYHWKIIILILIVGIVFVFCIAQCSAKIEPDLTVVLYCDAFIPTDSVLLMQNELAKFCDDYNGDGVVNIRIANCASRSDMHDEESTAKSSQLMLQFSNEEAILYIVDEEMYQKLLTIVENGFIDNTLGLPDKQGSAYRLTNTEFMKTLYIESAVTGNILSYTNKEFYAFCRATDNGTIIADKKDVTIFSQRAHEVLDKMITAYSSD